MSTLTPGSPAADTVLVEGGRGARALRRLGQHPVLAATLLSALLHLVWALFLATGGGDLAAQIAWARFGRDHPTSSYNLAWYGGMHPFSYSVLSPYVMGLLGIRPTAVLAGTLSATLAARLIVVSGMRRPMPAALWASFSLWCNVASGRVTFALGVLFGLAAVLVVLERRWSKTLRGVVAVCLSTVATLASPVAGLFVGVTAGALFLVGRRWAFCALAAGPPLVVAGSTLLFPFHGVQPMPTHTLLVPVGCAVGIAALAPRDWRTMRVGAVVYAAGVVVTWLVPSPIGTNVERFVLLFGGTVILMVVAAVRARHATRRRVVALWLLFTVTATWQVEKVVDDLLVSTSVPAWVRDATPLIEQLDQVHADRGRVEVVPARNHREAALFAPYVNLARGWNRQADVQRHPLFYDGTLTPDRYHAWLRRWAVGYVALPTGEPDGPAKKETTIIRGDQDWLHEVWHDQHWRLYRVAGARPLASAPASVLHAGPSSLVVRVPHQATVRLRVPWSPWLGVLGNSDGCLAPSQSGKWTVLRVPKGGEYRIGGTYHVPRGTPCDRDSG